MRYVFFCSTLLALLAPSASIAAVHPQMLWRQTEGSKVRFAFLTPAQADTFWADQDSVKRQSSAGGQGLSKSIERRLLERQLSDSSGVDVMFVTLIVTSDRSSRDTVSVNYELEFGINRNGEEIPSFGLLHNMRVVPGQSVYSYIVFPRIRILPTDKFFLRIPIKDQD